MSTYRQAIAAVIKDVQALGVDTYIPNRYIYNHLVRIAKVIVKRDSDTRRLFSQRHLFMPIKRVMLEERPSLIYTDSNFRISTIELPDVFLTYTGLAIVVRTIEPSDKTFLQINAEAYRQKQALEFKDSRIIYYFFEGRKLVFGDVSLKAVSIDGLFINPYEIKKLNGDLQNCEKFLDQEFLVPEYLEGDILKATTAYLAGSYVQIKPDAVPDMNENNRMQVQP